MNRQLNEEWTAYVVRDMHLYGITQRELALRCNYSQSYISEVLNCRKKYRSIESKNLTKNHIINTLKEMIDE